MSASNPSGIKHRRYCSAFCAPDRFYIQTFPRLNLDPTIRPCSFLFATPLSSSSQAFIFIAAGVSTSFTNYIGWGDISFSSFLPLLASAWTRCSMKNIIEKGCAPREYSDLPGRKLQGATRYLLYERCEHASHFSVRVLHSWLNEVTRANAYVRVAAHVKICTDLSMNDNMKISIHIALIFLSNIKHEFERNEEASWCIWYHPFFNNQRWINFSRHYFVSFINRGQTFPMSRQNTLRQRSFLQMLLVLK